MRQNLATFTDSASEWYESLRRIFTIALDLDGQVLLWGKEVQVIWPAFDDVVDPVFMRSEQTQESVGSEKVRATLFPAVIEKDAAERGMLRAESKEGLVFHSLVLLQ